MASTIPSFLLFTQNKLITTTAIHRSMKNNFPALWHAAALLGCFLTHRHAGYRWELSRRKKKQKNNSNSNNSNDSINNSNLSLLLIFFRPDRSLRKSHFLCGVYWFPFKVNGLNPGVSVVRVVWSLDETLTELPTLQKLTGTPHLSRLQLLYPTSKALLRISRGSYNLTTFA